MVLPEQLMTRRLIIRRFNLDDLDDLYNFMSNSEATKFLDFNEDQKTYEGCATLLEAVVGSYDGEEPVWSFVIERKHDGKYAGSIGIAPIGDSSECEAYYTITPEFWGAGYAYEAMMKFLQYVFSHTDIQRIVVYMNPENLRSIHLAEKLDMRHGGQVKHPILKKRSDLYSITKNQWFRSHPMR